MSDLTAEPIDDTAWGMWVARIRDEPEPDPEQEPDLMPILTRLMKPRQLPPEAWAPMPTEPLTFCQEVGRHVWSLHKPTCVLCGERP